MRKRRLFPLMLAACALLGSCKKPLQTETLLIAGSSTLQHYIQPVVKKFMADNPSIRVVSEAGGPAAALVALKHGAIDIATATRPAAAAEDDIYLREYLIARDGLAIVVNPANPVNELSTTQLGRIFHGEVTKWKDVGGVEGSIVLVDRDKQSNVKKSLEDLLLAGEPCKVTTKMAASSADMLAAVKSTPSAIGYLTLHKLGPGVKVLRVNGVEMSRITLLSGRYPLSRSFYLAVHLKRSSMAERFVEFSLSKTGQDLLAANGLLEVF